MFQPLLSRLDAARREIVVVSPYLTFPFTDALVRAARRGVQVLIVTPHENNKPLLRDYIVALARREGFQLAQTPAMSHVKAIIVDDATVVLGSSNFDFVSYEAEAEIIATFDDPALALDLRRRLIEPAMTQAVQRPAEVSAASGMMATVALRLAQGYIRALKGLRSSG
jgi:cardiolipin synthase